MWQLVGAVLDTFDDREDMCEAVSSPSPAQVGPSSEPLAFVPVTLPGASLTNHHPFFIPLDIPKKRLHSASGWRPPLTIDFCSVEDEVDEDGVDVLATSRFGTARKRP